MGASALHTGSFGALLSWAPDGPITGSGWRVQGLAQRGYYRYASPAAPGGSVHGRYTDVSVLLGYQSSSPGHGVTVSVGPALYVKDLTYRSPGDGAGSRFGMKAMVTGYGTVTPYLSGFMSASYSSADHAANVYANLGFALPHGLTSGPEFNLLDAADYRETRIGLHLSGMRVGRVQLTLSAGSTRDQDGRQGGHVAVNARMAF